MTTLMPAAFQPRGCRVEVNGQIKYDEAREDPNRVVKVIELLNYK